MAGVYELKEEEIRIQGRTMNQLLTSTPMEKNRSGSFIVLRDPPGAEFPKDPILSLLNSSNSYI